VTRGFAKACGIGKPAISERFIQASRENLKALMERSLGEMKRCAIVIDGTPHQQPERRSSVLKRGAAWNEARHVRPLRVHISNGGSNGG